MGGAEHHGGFDIVAHPHAEPGESFVAGEFRQQRELGRGFEAGGRHAHQPGEWQIGGARFGEQGGQVGDRAATLLRLVADVDLDEARRAAIGGVHRPGQRGDERCAVERMDRFEQRDGFGRLVRLELADEVERDAWRLIAQRRPFFRGFLYAVLAEDPLASGDQRTDRIRSVHLGHRDQGNIARVAPRDFRGVIDTGVDGV